MYLSKLILADSRAAVQWAAQPYRIHQRLAMASPDDPRLLFRREDSREATWLLVQTHACPDWDRAFSSLEVLAQPPLLKQVDWCLQPSQTLAFRLRANPTMRLHHDKEGNKIAGGKRVGVYGEENQLAWLARKADTNGFGLLQAQVRDEGLIPMAFRNPKRAMRLLSVQFDGMLQVTDVDRMTAALRWGIGSGKGLGFGLLTVAPVR